MGVSGRVGGVRHECGVCVVVCWGSGTEDEDGLKRL
jgi:hypothetical protein